MLADDQNPNAAGRLAARTPGLDPGPLHGRPRLRVCPASTRSPGRRRTAPLYKIRAGPAWTVGADVLTSAGHTDQVRARDVSAAPGAAEAADLRWERPSTGQREDQRDRRARPRLALDVEVAVKHPCAIRHVPKSVVSSGRPCRNVQSDAVVDHTHHEPCTVHVTGYRDRGGMSVADRVGERLTQNLNDLGASL